MKKLLTLLLLLAVLPVWAETKDARADMHHELRIGWGDQMFETLMWHKPAAYTIIPDYIGMIGMGGLIKPGEYRQTYSENFRYHQHMFVEYQYRVNHWFGVGALVDASGVSWDRITRDGFGNEVSRDEKRHNFMNFVVMPTMRFTYFHHEYVNIFSGLGVGIDINTGTEDDIFGHKTAVGAALQASWLGMSANYGRWFLMAEYGGTIALRDINTIFMVKSRMFTLSLGARF